MMIHGGVLKKKEHGIAGPAIVKYGTDSLVVGGSLHNPVMTRQEADSGSSNVAPQRESHSASCECTECKASGATLTAHKQSNNLRAGSALRMREASHPRNREGASQFQIRSRFNEAQAPEKEIGKFQVVLIKEGLGNLSDCFYYTKDALAKSYQLFEGAKCFADHPDAIQEKTRPERSTRDILGYFENVQYQESDGRGMITGTLCTVASESFDWAKALMSNAIDYAQKFTDSDFVGLSINANGSANEMDLQTFMGETQVPSAVLPKLQLAQAQGITSIRVVDLLTDCNSCDLVTSAGAGGQILAMIENERKPMKTNVNESAKMPKAKAPKHAKMPETEEKKEGEGMDKEAAPMPPQDKSGGTDNTGDGDDAGHDDADQDKALFKKMIAQYLPEHDGDEEAAMHMAKHAYEAYEADGMHPVEAYEMAGKHLQMAAKIGSKMAAKKPPTGNEDGAIEDGMEGHEASEKKEGEEKKEKKESARDAIIVLQAQNAKLREALKRYELTDYLDKKLSGTKLPVAVTKKFRESIGVPKSKEQIDHDLNLFKAALDMNTSDEAGFSFVFSEKSTQPFAESSDEGLLGSLSDCAI